MYSFQLTLKRINDLITDTIRSIVEYEKGSKRLSLDLNDITNTDLDGDDQNDDVFTIGKKYELTLLIWITNHGEEN